MANKSVTLHNDDNDNLYPNTTASLVYMTNGNTVESEITNIKEQNPNKGFYSTPSELYEVYPDNIQDPNTRAGWFVTMGSTDTIWLWDVEGNEWVNSFNKPSDVNSVNGQTGDVVLTGNNINATATVGVDSVTKSVDAHLTDLYTNKVDKTTTIAGVDLQDNITSNELYTGLGLGTVATHNVSTNGVEDNDSSIPTASQIKTYVSENGGKIDSISAGGTALTIDANKNVDIPLIGASINGSAGVVKTSESYGTTSGAGFGGIIAGAVRTYEQYKSDTNRLILSKGTLENVIDGKGFVERLTGSTAPTTSTACSRVGCLYLDTTNNTTYQCVAINEDTSTTPSTFTYTWVKLIRVTDRADQTTFGVVKVWGAYGTQIVGDSIGINPASESRITNRTSSDNRYCPITPANLNFAVKSSLTDANHLTMTSEEQTTAQSVIGASSRGIARL